eukprot:596030-Pelagomonas_calceolata.AAC.4
MHIEQYTHRGRQTRCAPHSASSVAEQAHSGVPTSSKQPGLGGMECHIQDPRVVGHCMAAQHFKRHQQWVGKQV